MNMLKRICILSLLLAGFSIAASAQCENWNNSPQKAQAEDAHVTYRPYVNGKTVADLKTLADSDFKIAFDNWKKAYDIAPAADGQRPFHFSDGRKFYRVMLDKTEDAAKKKEYADRILAFYEEEMGCYKNEAFLTGRKAYDMFYLPGYSSTKPTLDAINKAMELGGEKTEYIILDPLGRTLVWLYQKEKITKDEVRQSFLKAIEIADHNIANNKDYKQYYESGKANLEAHIKAIESDVFDCQYFKDDLLPKFEKNKGDYEVVDYVFKKLITQGCPDTDADVVKVGAVRDELYAAIRAAKIDSLRDHDPFLDGTLLQKEEKYTEAIKRYQDAIGSGDLDNEKLSQAYYNIAFIQTWELGQYQSARDNARKAASLRSGWGKPYILIGDMYGKTTRNCGDAWNQRLAVLAAIEKYQYARSIDSDVASDASKRIGNYSSSLPDSQEGFMRGAKAGDKATVGCWIGETVTIRYK